MRGGRLCVPETEDTGTSYPATRLLYLHHLLPCFKVAAFFFFFFAGDVFCLFLSCLFFPVFLVSASPSTLGSVLTDSHVWAMALVTDFYQCLHVITPAVTQTLVLEGDSVCLWF